MTSDELRQTRVDHLRMTQDELADALGCHRRAVLRAENGQTKVSKMMALALQTVRPKSLVQSKDLGPWQERHKRKLDTISPNL